MNEEKLNKLTALRDKVMENVSPLADNENLSPEQRFTLLMSTASYQNDEAMLEKAFEAAQQIEAEDAKTAALLDLLDEVELQISDVTNPVEGESDNPEVPQDSDERASNNQEVNQNNQG